MRVNRQHGFGALEGIFVVGVIVIVGIVGFMFIKRHSDQTANQAASTNVPAAPEVKDTSSLDAATKTLDQTNVDAASSDASQLDSLTNGF